MSDAPAEDSGVAGRLARLETRLAVVAAALDKIAATSNGTESTSRGAAGRPTGGTGKPAADRPSIWCWKEITDPEVSEARLTELAEWVAWLTGRYPKAFRDMPPCWYLHSDAVEELTALWEAWLYAYHGDDEPREAPMVWHDRWMSGTCHRLLGTAGVLAPCIAGSKHHQPNLTGAVRNNFDPVLDDQTLLVATPTYPA